MSVVLSVSRLMVVLYPFDSNFKRASYTLEIARNCTGLSFLISLLFTLITKFVIGNISVKFCVPLFSLNSSILFVNLIWLLVICQLLLAISLPGIHIATVITVKKSERNFPGKQREGNTALTVQLFLSAFCTGCCWISRSVICITALFLDLYPLELIPWTTVTIVPLNAVTMPTILIVFLVKRAIKVGWQWEKGQNKSPKKDKCKRWPGPVHIVVSPFRRTHCLHTKSCDIFLWDLQEVKLYNRDGIGKWGPLFTE